MRIFVGELTTGRNIIPIPARDGEWAIRRNRGGSLSAEVTLSAKAHRRLDLYQSAMPGRAYLAIAEGDFIFEAGPIWEHEYNDDSRRLRIDAEGIWSMLMRRFIMPAAVETIDLLLQSGDDAGKPNPAVATLFTGATWPAIVRQIIQQGMARAGGALPFVFGPDGVGAHDKSYDAASFKTQGEAFTDITELVDGPEIEFRAEFAPGGTGVQWRPMVGDDAQLQITRVGAPHRFDFSTPQKSVSGLVVKRSARDMTSEAWATGGRQAAIALISRAASDALQKAGFPRMESLSAAHSTVKEQATLDAYAWDDLGLGSGLAEWWSFDTDIDRVPKVGSFTLGDYCDVVLRRNPYLPDGTYRRRIAALSGQLRSRRAKVTTDEVIAA
ncbi:hypothetical protein [uncultured Microbacterium sp.]|uniref:hypothetical protein n=1 Tax=uncultured Microbacterium sp. TaxID=191216 RepID=UPI0025D24A86|nr:hypothetical protein [uncultured Microbacterium sp.]